MEEDMIWVTPAGHLGTYRELDYIQTFLSAHTSETSTPATFEILGDVPPEFLSISGSTIVGYVDLLEYWLDDFKRPDPYVVDDNSDAFGNYAKYGIYSRGMYDYHFTVRAFANGVSENRSFFYTLEPNYSSLRDRTLIEFFTNETEEQRGTLAVGGEKLTAEEWIVYWKSKGLYS